jgi:hypothetical protein
MKSNGRQEHKLRRGAEARDISMNDRSGIEMREVPRKWIID